KIPTPSSVTIQKETAGVLNRLLFVFSLSLRIESLQLFQRAAAAYKCPTMFSDVGMNDAVFVILDMNHRRLVLFLPTGQEDTWSDWRDRNLNGLRGSFERTIGGRERHHCLRFEVEMMNPTTEICFIHMADGWKMGSGHRLLPLIRCRNYSYSGDYNTKRQPCG